MTKLGYASWSLLTLGSLTLGCARAQRASNFDIPAVVSQAHFCGVSCQQTIAQRNALDLQILGDFDFDFYETAPNFLGSEPGDLLKLIPVDASAGLAPDGVSAFKIQYTSLSAEGDPVPATGFIALPSREGCRRSNLVAYAHGTTGLYRGCARSEYTDFFDYNGWMLAASAGYAVVATD